MGIFSKLSKKLRGLDSEEDFIDENNTEYVELDTDGTGIEADFGKVVVRPFAIEDFSDIKPILDALREGHTIALINIKSIKEKDIIELKRAINKIKKTVDALDGDIAGFGEDYLVATPSFAKIHRTKETPKTEPSEQ